MVYTFQILHKKTTFLLKLFFLFISSKKWGNVKEDKALMYVAQFCSFIF